MKRKWTVVAFAAACAIALAGCSGIVKPPVILVENVTLNEYRKELEPGRTFQFVATVTPDNAYDAEVTWTSSNNEVATVDKNGLVTALEVSEYPVYISAQAGEKTAVCEIYVYQPTVSVDRIELSDYELTLYVNGSWGYLSATVFPSNAGNNSVWWQSDNENIAKVCYARNNACYVEAINEGTTVIKAEAGGKTAECVVTVKPQPVTVDSIELNMYDLPLKVGEKFTLEATATSNDVEVDNVQVGWSVDAQADAVSYEFDGKYCTVTAEAEGIADIYAYVGNERSMICHVTVSPQDVGGDEDDNGFVSDENNPGLLTQYNGNEETVTIPDWVTQIGNNAFKDNKNITSVVISDKVTEIGWNAFNGCAKLESVVIPNTVSSIQPAAFMNCTNLKEVTIPNYVTKIDTSVFQGCENLMKVDLHSGVTEIGNQTFQGCTRLTDIEIPANVTKVGFQAFQDCEELTNITIPNNVTKIENMSFSGCAKLNNITIPEGVDSIGEGAFYKCASLTNVTILAKLTEIGEYAFADCTKLTTVNYAGTEAQWENLVGTNSDIGLSDEVTINYGYDGAEDTEVEP